MVEAIEISGNSGGTVHLAKRKVDLDQKLEQNKQARQVAKETRLIVQGEEEKLPEEDYNLIDEYFSTTYVDLQARTINWQSTLPAGTAVDQITAYFEDLHTEAVTLREMLTNYQYAIPTGMFSRYQASMRQYMDLFAEKKEAAKPTKKFAFVRKKRGAAPKAQPVA